MASARAGAYDVPTRCPRKFPDRPRRAVSRLGVSNAATGLESLSSKGSQRSYGQSTCWARVLGWLVALRCALPKSDLDRSLFTLALFCTH